VRADPATTAPPMQWSRFFLLEVFCARFLGPFFFLFRRIEIVIHPFWCGFEGYVTFLRAVRLLLMRREHGSSPGVVAQGGGASFRRPALRFTLYDLRHRHPDAMAY